MKTTIDKPEDEGRSPRRDHGRLVAARLARFTGGGIKLANHNETVLHDRS